MKQNSSILFHDMRKPLRNSYLRSGSLAVLAISVLLASSGAILSAADQPEYLASFDPAKGFKPAQGDLTEVFLQIAGSLEASGSPEPYLRHMKAEHERVEAKYRQRFGRESKAYWPAYMTDEYFDQFAANWKVMAPRLGLEALCRRTGNLMRDAINGTRGNGTMLVEIFNQHQAKVFNAMAGKSQEPANYDALKKELIARLYLDQSAIHDEHFTIPQRDAVDFVIGIRGAVNDLFGKLDAQLNATDAAQIKSSICSIYTDIGRLGQAELEEAIVETALNRQSAIKSANVH